ncbi:pig-C [Coprinopsis cinerea okayama7|uniref:Pig-C n=1 Tax=Coprinopsis cinerea (strain Okayama-7 / 130 / ATCC MYA-4618 / FGSC 9003) TaxID=240176 RepID=A8N736_COPC7|nr:pig-C [Coprinopsis cinerea okayama7\|eukprot:XP_001830642.2 pig-C [Coprinopsis cinerea okayama7\
MANPMTHARKRETPHTTPAIIGVLAGFLVYCALCGLVRKRWKQRQSADRLRSHIRQAVMAQPLSSAVCNSCLSLRHSRRVAVNGDPKMTVEPWSKALWKSQPYPDDYVPPDVFLASLQRNPHFKPYTYWPLVILTCTITQHVSVIFIFVAVFGQLNAQLLDPRTLISISVACFLVGYAAWTFLDSTPQRPSKGSRTENHLKAIKSSIMIFLSLVSLSPVLRTLSAATSSDSIWALAAVLFLLNTLLSDYTWTTVPGELRGRAFVHLIPYPQNSNPVGQLSRVVMGLCSAVLFFITFVAPMLLVWAQKYKNNIRGPWDVATPKVR